MIVRKKKWWIVLVAPPMLVLLAWLFGELVMHLWNWLLPAIFGWKAITFWQALGLLVLCRILFGSFGNGGGHKAGWRERRAMMLESLTPEEREKLRGKLRARCGFPFADEPREPAQ
jgi:hypothetical protein